MRIESALYASRDGLFANGQAISVVGDNIANANTTGYKTSRIEFSDLVSGGGEGSSLSGAEGGNGVKVSAVRQLHEAGTVEFTGRELDLGIGGDGFFIVNDGGRNIYTRAGNFEINSSGLLVDSEGNNVMGYAPDTQTGLSTINMKAITQGGTPTTKVSFSGNVDASAAIGTVPATPASFQDLADSPLVSSVDVYDSLGAKHSIQIAFTKTSTTERTWTANAYIDGQDVTGGTKGVPVLIGTQTGIKFTPGGIVAEADKANAIINAAVTYGNGANAGAFTIDVSPMSQYSAGSLVNSVTKDGIGTGSVDSYEFEKDGTIFAKLDNGSRKSIGIIALADFTNLDGLTRAGNSSYLEGAEVGTSSNAKPGSNGLGELQARSLELSTVDIAEQFVNLVVYQRAYQASSQTLNAANTIIRDTLGLIR